MRYRESFSSWYRRRRTTTGVVAGVCLLLALAACASPVYLVDPNTGQTVQCASTTAWSGLGGAVITGVGANIAVQRCVQQMESLGYVRADNIPEAKRALDEKNRQQATKVKDEAKKLLEQGRALVPDRPYCRLGTVLWPDGTVVRVEQTAANYDVRPGDRIVAVTGKRLSGSLALLSAIFAHRPDDQVVLVLVRDGAELERKVNCGDGSPVRDKQFAMLAAASQGQWSECITLSYELERLPSSPASVNAIVRHLCNESDRAASGRQNSISDARLYYEARKRQIEEAQYVSGGLEKIRGDVLATISDLERSKFSNFANDLRDQLATVGGPQPAQPAGPKPRQATSGTCFAVTPDGGILTAYHVVKDGGEIWVSFPSGQREKAVIEQAAGAVDVALVRISRKTENYLSLASTRSATVGQSVFTVGFPATQVLGMEPKYTDGSISALSGVGGEASFMQITVPIQPGNSGGPLVNERGEVLGVITSTAAIAPFLKLTGTLPQNVNWAVKSDYALPLFSAPKVQVSSSKEDAIKRALSAVCLVEVSGK